MAPRLRRLPLQDKAYNNESQHCCVCSPLQQTEIRTCIAIARLEGYSHPSEAERARESSRDFCSDWTCCGAWDLLLCFGLAALAWTCCSGLELLLCCGLAALAGTCSWEKMSTLNPVLDWCCDWTGCAAGDLLLCCGLASLAWTCFKEKMKFLCELCLGILL